MPNFVITREAAVELQAAQRRRQQAAAERRAPVEMIDRTCADLEEYLLIGVKDVPRYMWRDLHRLEQVLAVPHHYLHGPGLRSKVVMERLWDQRRRLVDVDDEAFPELPDEPADRRAVGRWHWYD